MARPRQAKKHRSSLSKIKQRPKSTAKLRNPRGNAIIAANWENDATLSQNYKRLGLVAKLNSVTGGGERRAGTHRDPGDSLLIRSQPRKDQKAREVKVKRDSQTGAILRILHESEGEEDNPLNDVLRDLDSDDEDDQESSRNASLSASTDVVMQLEGEAARPSLRRPRQQSEQERAWLQQLVDRHGEDYRKMATDRKLNPMQQTESDIRKRLKRWKNDVTKGKH